MDAPRFDLDDAVPAALDPEGLLDPHAVEAILHNFDREVALARPLLDRGDAELDALWSLQRSGREIFCVPRAAAVRTLVLGHIVHHRGQLTVYLRLNEIAVPAIYGPTADTMSAL